MSDELKLAVENLSLKDKVELREYLSDMINSSRRLSQSPLRCSILLGTMAAALGWEHPIPYEGRESHCVWARTMVAYQKSKKGYPTIEIGKKKKKNRTTIIHLLKKMQDVFAFPQMYENELEMWYKFQKQIEYDIHERTTQNPFSLGGEFPDCSQGEMGEESGEDCPPGDL